MRVIQLVGWVALLRMLLTPATAQTLDPAAVLSVLDIPVVLPQTLPAGFSAAYLELAPCPAPETGRGSRFCPHYRVIYQNPENQCFAVEATGGGVGGVSQDFRFEVQNPRFGTVAINFGETGGLGVMPSSTDLKTPQERIFADWAGTGPFYRVSTAFEDVFAVNCFAPITPATVAAVVEALAAE